MLLFFGIALEIENRLYKFDFIKIKIKTVKKHGKANTLYSLH